MSITRRDWLSVVVAGACGAFSPSRSICAQNDTQDELERRIGRLIHEYEQQGFHRTGTAVDRRSGDWLIKEVRRIGLVAEREPFALNRIDPANANLIVRDRRIEGLPLFDGTFTDAEGIRGTIGPIESNADIGLAEAAPNTAARVYWVRLADTSATRPSCVSPAVDGLASVQTTQIPFSGLLVLPCCKYPTRNHPS